ncbi:ABC-F family ATP-binding cassette domain-containing protein [uncultured Microscilla sp.]|uniref:ABC-F family ATP-binding cassette domain-containing protein n=1 Tax=uncultured Microscilla sp. TaxID=432653 RepID=UPI00262F99B0|nr:ABC-F family ATP-binding cassette domain-containing protein [uncultured Microscilla sp.]
MNYLSVENLSKSFGERVLFENISFGINKGQKVALVAKNGTGKTSLLKILTGKDGSNSGEVVFHKDVHVGFLDQNPDFGSAETIIEAVLNSNNPVIQAIKTYEEALQDPNNAQKMEEGLAQMDTHKAWDYELKIKQILSKLRVDDLEKRIDTLSGGQKKRVALAKVLIDEPDFLILDEPTNHLDLDMIEWLENYLSASQLTLLMVTHDRYFLDRICTEIIELDRQTLFRFKGNYEYYLEKKAELTQQAASEVEKAQNLMRKELDWVRRQPKARGTKAKYRLDAFDELKKKANSGVYQKEANMGVKMSRMGKKILEIENLHKSYGDLKMVENFSYVFQRRERIGIVGQNGVGKSTFLNLLTGKIQPDSGEITKGETIVYGYYTQEGIKLPEDKRVIEVVQEIAEEIELDKGQKLSPAQLLERFLFDRDKQYNYVSTLSGGERRRLYLLTVLVQNPNFLILDEPTNDLDLLTLNVLEEFLADFGGCLIIVTHDRYFMDKLVDHLFVFEGEGFIRDFNGKYREYREFKHLQELEKEKEKKESKQGKQKEEKSTKKTADDNQKRKLSYKEQREYEGLEQEIEQLEEKKDELTEKLNSGTLDHEKLQKTSQKLGEIIDLIDSKTERWLELAEFI